MVTLPLTIDTEVPSDRVGPGHYVESVERRRHELLGLGIERKLDAESLPDGHDGRRIRLELDFLSKSGHRNEQESRRPKQMLHQT